MKFELSSLTDIRFDIFDKSNRGAYIEEGDCNGLLEKAAWCWVFEEAIDGFNTMKVYKKYR